jgi:FkbM family methyltransferase
MRKLLKHFYIIHSHPTTKGRWFSAMRRTFSWLFAWKILRFKKLVFPYLEHSQLLASSGTIGCAGSYICSLYEFEEMAFLLHFLREGDLVFDVGANIGWYTILAAAERKCNVVSFEPVPTTFSILKTNVILNEVDDLVSLNLKGVGSKIDVLNFTSNRDVENRVALPNDDKLISVEMTTIDTYIHTYRCPEVIKIDVEGFETEVLNGAEQTLKNENLKVLIVELVGHGKKYGFDEDIVKKKLSDLGFIPVTYKPRERKIHSKNDNETTQNCIYIRDTIFVETRINTAHPYNLFGKQI